MKRLILALSFVTLTGSALPVAAQAQAPIVASTAPVTPPAYNAGGLPRTPTYNTVEGQPIDSAHSGKESRHPAISGTDPRALSPCHRFQE